MILTVFEFYSQLYYDGHQNLALQLSNLCQADPPCPPSDRLLHLVLTGVAHEPDRTKKENSNNTNSFTLANYDNTLGSGLDLEYETETQTQAPEPAQYETAYVTSHKGNCRAGAFSWDGQLIGNSYIFNFLNLIFNIRVALIFFFVLSF